MTNYLAHDLADFIVSVTSANIGDAVRTRAEAVLLDVIACAAAGFHTRAAASARRCSQRVFGAGDSPIWLTGDRCALPGAIFANVAAATALDLDDGHRLACGHPAAGVIPVVTALARREGRDAFDILTAIIVGYEVGVRVAASRDIAKIETTATGQWLSYATAASAGWILGLNRECMGHALAIAGTLWPNMLVNGWSNEKGNAVKEGMPWSAVTGYVAAELALEGFTGAGDVLDGSGGYDRQKILAGTGVDWAITRNYFKFYSACRHAHPSIDMILELAEAGELPERIDAIDVYTFDRALKLNNHPAPPNIIAAQYSLPFCIALAVVLGRPAVSVIVDEYLSNSDVLALAGRIRLHHDRAIQGQFPANTLGRLVITGGGRRIERRAEFCSGDWQTGDNTIALREKFNALTHGIADEAWRKQMPEAVRGLRTRGADDLFAVLEANTILPTNI